MSLRSVAAGSSMVEVLVTIVILTVGLLGMAGLQSKALTAQVEAYQRAQALTLLQDMVDRINANRANAANYETDDPLGTEYNDSATLTCTALTGKDLDWCEWHNALLGAAETSSGTNVGAMIGARGCIYATGTNQYLIAVAWQGMTATAASSIDCGEGEYGSNDAYRRVIAAPITIATLN